MAPLALNFQDWRRRCPNTKRNGDYICHAVEIVSNKFKTKCVKWSFHVRSYVISTASEKWRNNRENTCVHREIDL